MAPTRAPHATTAPAARVGTPSESAPLPADRRGCWSVLAAHNAAGPVLEAARRLPESGEYADVTEVVKALVASPRG